MKIIGRVLALLLAARAACALADDAVGVMRVDVACTLQATQPSESASGVHGRPWGQTPWKPHARNFQLTYKKILSMLSDNGTYTREACRHKRKDLVDKKFQEARDMWNIRKMNEGTHSGTAWREWRKNHGKSETDEELW